MYFLNDSKQAKMNNFQLLDLFLNAVNWTTGISCIEYKLV